MHGPGERVDRQLDAGHVRTGRKGSDLQPPLRKLVKQVVQAIHVDQAALVGLDAHDVRQRLQPGRMVGVMLHMRDEDNRAILRRQPDKLV